MAKLYFHDQLVATSDEHGILGANLSHEEIVITYPHRKNKHYTVIMYDDNDVHSLLININGDDLSTGDILVDYHPFVSKLFNYDAMIYIYEQPSILPLPSDDFDMEDYTVKNNLILLYKIEFTVLQMKLIKPNLFSTRTFNQKIKLYKNLL
ncbi:MAG TPA: hypothetical protein VLG50_08355 [Candidatus Saccharimonadales bacterium]|nr:hypothetical protein [Candidatus Saccharimonadales bacterium]